MRKESINEKGLLYSIALYVGYIFWFQYGVREIGGILLLLGGMMALFIVLNLKSLDYYSELFLPIIFVILLCILTPIVAYDKTRAYKYDFDLIKYIIATIAIHTYVDGNKYKMRKILWIISWSCVAQSFSLIFSKSTSGYGTSTLEGYNNNALSGCLTIGLFAALMLYDEKKRLKDNILVILSISATSIAQILCASRRGFLITVMMLAIYIFSCYVLIVSKNESHKLKFWAVCFIVFFIAIYYFASIFTKSVMFQRLSGEKTGGDVDRVWLHELAIEAWNKDFLFGQGLGVVGSMGDGRYAHSIYYELVATSGVTGFVLFLIFWIILIFVFMNAFISRKYMPFYRIKIVVFLLICVEILISGFAMVFFYDPNYYVRLGMTAALYKVFKIDELSDRERLKGKIYEVSDIGFWN